MRLLRTFVVLLCLAVSGALALVVPANAVVSKTGTYYPVATFRLLDTRKGLGAPKQQLGPNQTLHVQVGGVGGIPASGVSAVVLNITVTGATAGSYLTIFPSGVSRPNASSINFPAGWTGANISTVGIGTGGKIDIFNRAGSVSVIADVVGYYAADNSPALIGDEYVAVNPKRLFDTRKEAAGPLAGHTHLIDAISFDSGSLDASVRALAINVTAVNGKGSGYLSVWDGVGTAPSTSTLNFNGASPVPNLAVVKTSHAVDGKVQFGVYNGSIDSVNVFVDLVGVYYNDGSVGLRFRPIAPVRISDSRTPLNGTPLTAGQSQTLTAPGSVAGPDTIALVTNTTAVQPTASTYLTLWMTGTRPGVSNLNARAGSIVSNGVVVEVTSANNFMIFNSVGTTNFIIDVTGRFDIGPSSSAALSAKRKAFSSLSVAGAPRVSRGSS
jgi:hypothetical protein